MGKLLFEEGRSKGAEYRKEALAVKIMLASFAVVFISLLVVCLLLGKYIISIIPGACILITVLAFVFSLFQETQSLRVYEDKIVCRRNLGFKAKEFALTPSQYTIEVKGTVPVVGYSVKFIFRDAESKKILTYRAVSLHPTSLAEEKKQWEADLYAIGCEITDKKEIIKNK